MKPFGSDVSTNCHLCPSCSHHTTVVTAATISIRQQPVYFSTVFFTFCGLIHLGTRPEKVFGNGTQNGRSLCEPSVSGIRQTNQMCSSLMFAMQGRGASRYALQLTSLRKEQIFCSTNAKTSSTIHKTVSSTESTSTNLAAAVVNQFVVAAFLVFFPEVLQSSWNSCFMLSHLSPLYP